MADPVTNVLTRRVAATPDRTAVITAETGEARSYSELDTDVSEQAAKLAGLGLENGDRLGLLADTSISTFELVLAAFRLGVQLVPLNVRNTADESSRQLTTANVDQLICSPEHVPLARSATSDRSIEPISLKPTDSVDSLNSVNQAPIGPGEWGVDETMIVMFTSGTTGTANAVPLSVRNMQWSAIASAFRLGTVPGDRWLCCLPIYHMGGLAPIFRTVLYGSTAVVLGETDSEQIAQATHRHSITGVSLVPTILHRIIESEASLSSTLRFVLLGGAPTSEELLQTCEKLGIPIHPTYGLTETASQVATATPREAFENPGTVGQPLFGTEVTIIDETGTEQETGEVGEIVVAGPTVTQGYLGSGKATFSRHGFHTGDLGYRDEAGRLWVTGRVEDRIVTGGETVHTGTVESALHDHPAVKNASVVGLADPEWGERVGAVVVSEADVEVGELQRFCNDRLADYERPRTIQIVQSLPRTSSGTVDRNAVKEILTKS